MKPIEAICSGLSTAQRHAMVRRCDGIPLYLEEVVHSISSPAATLPTAIGCRMLSMNRCWARLLPGPHVVPVGEAAAVVGRYVDRGLLRSVVALAEPEFEEVVGKLEADLVFEPWGPDGWRFHRELLREVAAELAPPSVRRQLHARLTECLKTRHDEPDCWLVAVHNDHGQLRDHVATAQRIERNLKSKRMGTSRFRRAMQSCSAGVARVPARMARVHARGVSRWTAS